MSELLPFGDIAEMHKQLSEQSPFFARLSPEQFAQLGNEWTGTSAFQRGVDDNWVKQFSRGVDTFLAGSSAATEELGSAVAQLVAPQYDPQFRSFGAALPRDLITMGLLAGGPVGITGAAGLAGSRAYEESGSAKAGGIAAGMTALLPASARRGGELAASGLRRLLYGTEQIGEQTVRSVAPTFVGAGLLERTLEAAGRNVGVLANQEIATQLTSQAVTGEWYPVTPQHIAELAGPQAAFGVVDLLLAMVSPKGLSRSLTALRANEARDAAVQQAAIEQGVPPKITVAKKVPTTKPVEQEEVEEPLRIAADLQTKYKTMQQRSKTALRLATSKTVSAEERKALDAGLIEELKTSGSLTEGADGSLTVVKPPAVTADDLVSEALRLFDGRVVMPPKVKSSEAFQTPRSEEFYRRQYEEVPGELERAAVEPSETPRGETRTHARDVQPGAPSFAAEQTAKQAWKDWRARNKLYVEEYQDWVKAGKKGSPPNPVPQPSMPEPGQLGGAPEPAQQPPLLTHATGKPAVVITPELRQSLLKAKPGTEQVDMRLVDEAIVQQLKPLVDAEVQQRLQRTPDANISLDVKLARLLEIRTSLEKVLREAFVRRGLKGEELERHPAYSDYFSSFSVAMNRLSERFGKVPTEKLLDEAYNATMADVAVKVRTLQALVDETAQQLPPVVHNVETFQKLVQLEEVPHGPAVLAALARVYGGQIVRSGIGTLDVGMLRDRAFYGIMDHAVKLLDQAQYARAREAYFVKEPAQRVRYEKAAAPERFEIDKAIAERFIRKLSAAEDLDALESFEAYKLVYLENLAREAKVQLHDLPLTSLGEWLEGDPVQRAAATTATEWFVQKFTQPLTFDEWNAAGYLTLVRRGNVKERVFTDPTTLANRYKAGRFGTKTARAELGEKYNKTLELLRSGELQIRYDRGGFEVKEPTNKADILRRMGVEFTDTPAAIESSWRNFRNRTMADVVARLNAMYERELNIKSSEVFESGGVEGTVSAGNKAIAGFVEQGNDPGGLAFIAGARQWFREHYAKRGFTNEAIEAYSDILTKVAAAFPEVPFSKMSAMHDVRRLGVMVEASSPYDPFLRYIVGVNESLQKDPRVSAAQAAMLLAHELMHRRIATTPEALTWSEGLLPEERATLLRQLHDVVFPREVQRLHGNLSDQLAFRTEIASKDAEEFLADFAGLYTMGFVSPDKKTTLNAMGDVLLFSDSHTQQFLQGFFLSINDLAQGLGEFFKRNNAALAEPFERIVDGMRGTLNKLDDIERSVAVLRQLERAEPANYMQLVAAGYNREPFNVDSLVRELEFKSAEVAPTLRKAAEKLGLAKDVEATKRFGVQLPVIRRTFMESHQLAQMYPQLRGVFDLVRQYRTLSNTFVSKVLQPVMRTSKRLKQQVLDVTGSGMGYVLQHQQAREAFNRIALKEQLEGRRFTDAEMRAEMVGLSATAQQRVVDYRNNVREVMTQSRAVLIDSLWKAMMYPAAQRLMLTNKSLRASQARSVAEQIATLQWKAHHGDAMAQAQLNAMSATKDMVDAIAMVRDTQLPIVEFEKKTAGNDWYMSEMRTGRYYVGYVNPAGKGVDKTGLAAFDTKEQAMAWANKESARTGVPIDKFRHWDKYVRGEESKALNPDFLATLQQIERQAQIHHAMELDIPAEMLPDVLSYQPMAAALKEITEGGTKKYLMERQLRAGREEVDMAGNLLPHVRGMANSLAKRITRGEVGLALMDPELRSQPELHQLAVRHFNNVLEPPTGELSFAKRMLFGYYLGFNPSSMIINAFDSLISLTPQLTQDSGRIGVGYRYLGRAVNALAQIARQGKLNDAELDGTWNGDPHNYSSGLLDRARKEQRIDFGVVQETYDAEVATAVNVSALANGAGGVVQLGKRALDLYATAGRWLYGNVTKLNSHIAFLSAYRMAREFGVLQEGRRVKLSPEQAYKYAVRTVDSTQHSGGIASRPPGMFSNLGKMHGAVGLAYSLSTYTVGTISMMARLGLQSIGRLPTAERAAARKAFGQMMFTQTALAGVLGLPGVAFALSTLNWLFPELEATQAVEDGFRALAGDDDDMGNLFADLAMRGVPNKALGVDLSSRLALANVLGVSAYDGISLPALLGPGGGVIENALKATQLAGRGEYATATERLVPTPYKNLVHLYRNQGVLRDAAGRPLVKPTDYEAALFVLGFRPARLTELRDKQRLVEQHDNVVRLENQQFNRQAALRMMAGDIAGTRQMLVQRQMETNGNYLAARGALDVAEEVIDRMAPFDLARGGARLASGTRRQMAAQVGGAEQPWSETQRLMTKKALAAQLGVPGRIAPTEMRLAQLVDQLMAANPMLGRAEAVQMAQVLMGRQLPQLGR